MPKSPSKQPLVQDGAEQDGAEPFRRTGETKLAYGAVAYFAYLQALPGSALPFLVDKLDIDLKVAGLHLTAFAFGSLLAGYTTVPIEGRFGKHRVLVSGQLGMLIGAALVGTAFNLPWTLVGAFSMGLLGSFVLIQVQAIVGEQHGSQRAVALTELNLIASLSATCVPIVVAVAAEQQTGWQGALIPVACSAPMLWLAQRRTLPGPGCSRQRVSDPHPPAGRLPGSFRLGALMLFCAVAIEWSVGYWGSVLLRTTFHVANATAIATMSVFYLAMLLGRGFGSVLTRRYGPGRLLGGAIVVSTLGFVVVLAAAPLHWAAAGLLLLGLGVGNMFPLSLAISMSTAPDRPGLASARCISTAALALLTIPAVVGWLADETSIRRALSLVVALSLLAASVALLSRFLARLRVESTAAPGTP